jgi:phosphatidylinositol alpha-1,6-mannosyltransferase
MLKSITLINSGLRQNNIRLQPWRYLFEVIIQLQRLGHPVTLISDERTGITDLTGIRVILLESTSNPKWSPNQTLARVMSKINSDVILWHVGLTSFLHQNFNINLAKPTLGIFTSPIYSRKDWMRLGWCKLFAGYQLCSVNIIGSLLPIPLLRKWMRNSGLDGLVVQTESTLDSAHTHHSTRRG